MRVLIAEDDAVTARILTALVESDGHTVTVATGGAAAFTALTSVEPPELVLMDWIMPEMNGLELCRAVRARADAVPPYLILLTARSSPADVVIGLDAGADDYLVKPFNRDELRARMRAGARIRRLEQDLAGRIHDLEAALANVDRLTGLLPMCAYCKSIRDDSDYWHRVESYISDHADVQFSHGICPDCVAKLEIDEQLA
jgi:DNA-binding response OmpR family regulator